MVAAAITYAASAADEAKDGWVSLFDGKTLDNWKANGKLAEGAFTVEDGMIVAHGQGSHLFYVGPVQDHAFKNFEFQADVMTTTGSNSGIFFHTRFDPAAGGPIGGYEAQIDSSHSDPRRTGSLYNVKNIEEPKPNAGPSQDGKWFHYDIAVSGKHIVFKIDGKTVLDYTEPADVTPPKNKAGRQLSRGTFALQAHPPAQKGQSGITYFKNIKVKSLPE
jgi:hypothetical protein